MGAIDIADWCPCCFAEPPVDATRDGAKRLFQFVILRDLRPALRCNLQICDFAAPIWPIGKEQVEGLHPLDEAFGVVEPINANQQRSPPETLDDLTYE